MGSLILKGRTRLEGVAPVMQETVGGEEVIRVTLLGLEWRSESDTFELVSGGGSDAAAQEMVWKRWKKLNMLIDCSRNVNYRNDDIDPKLECLPAFPRHHCKDHVTVSSASLASSRYEASNPSENTLYLVVISQ